VMRIRNVAVAAQPIPAQFGCASGSDHRALAVVRRNPETMRDRARVTLRYSGKTQVQEVMSQSGFYSASDLRLHFGLGAAIEADVRKCVAERRSRGDRPRPRELPAAHSRGRRSRYQRQISATGRVNLRTNLRFFRCGRNLLKGYFIPSQQAGRGQNSGADLASVSAPSRTQHVQPVRKLISLNL
jgi:hypothetical protein